MDGAKTQVVFRAKQSQIVSPRLLMKHVMNRVSAPLRANLLQAQSQIVSPRLLMKHAINCVSAPLRANLSHAQAFPVLGPDKE